MPKIITPLRWTGGKTRAINKIKNRFPTEWNSFYEPFLGGGSIFLYLKQLYPDRKYIINDMNERVYNLWLWLKNNPSELSERCIEISKSTNRTESDGKELFNKVVNELYGKEFTHTIDNAVNFWILNKIQYSGSEKARFSPAAFGCGSYLGKGAFSDSNAEKLKEIGDIINQGGEVEITYVDYEESLKTATKDDFVFLDPPYKLEPSKSTLYGVKGEIHKTFDHDRFAKLLNNSEYKFMITYDTNEDHLKNFNDEFLFETFEHKYTTIWGKNGKAVNVDELIIRNYEV